MDDTENYRPKRQKRDSSYKAKAFERFKQLKEGKKNKYEDEDVDNIYETVDEAEYVKTVLSRQDDDWIVDDDGSGYVEDGREIFDDDLDMESIAAATASGKSKGTKRKKKHVSENAAKGNLQYMLSNMPSAKKKEEAKIDNDQILSELLGEIDGSPSSASGGIVKPKAVTANFKTLSAAKKAENDYLKSFATPKRPAMTIRSSPTVVSSTIRDNVLGNKGSTLKDRKRLFSSDSQDKGVESPTVCEKELTSRDTALGDSGADCDDLESNVQKSNKSENPEPRVSDISGLPKQVSEPSQEQQTSVAETPAVPEPAATAENDILLEDDIFNDDLDMSVIAEFETPMDDLLDGAETANDIEPQNFLQNWDESVDVESNVEDQVNEMSLANVGDKDTFRFFWWDAFENAAIQPGVVFLFGKTHVEEAKAFVSCCVAVRGIERKLYFLPRQYHEDTNEEVTTKDVYNEINETLMKPRQVKTFKARPITKKYAFDPEIPRESDYIEVRYSANSPGISPTTTGKTFSRVFGTESSYLEILLLDRKIKGPCWLDVSNPVRISNPTTWCRIEIDCHKTAHIGVVGQTETPLAPPPLVVSAINMRRVVNPKTRANEIVMLSCVTNTCYAVDKQIPGVPFQKHFCVFTAPQNQVLPINLHTVLSKYNKTTTVQKMDSEKALLNYFINTFAKLDSDLIVGHDLQGYQINVLSERIAHYRNTNFGKLGRLKRTVIDKQKLDRDLFVGRLVCDLKISAKELIKCRSYDLDTLCQTVLKLEDGGRIDLKLEDILEMFNTAQDILKLISVTMQDTVYILKMMYHLNVIPLALQITNIAGNVMSKTLLGGRSERNEYLLLHAFSEKDYIVPDKVYKRRKEAQDGDEPEAAKPARKKAAYAGGLVLEPKVGFYDKLILLMDFNSLYPSIIQEYNICFTTMPVNFNSANMVLPDRSLPLGILPTEIRKLVESRRAVKALMNAPDISGDLKMQYHIRQMALKLTANSMYGCLGFSNSRFHAQNLAALITHKGREILTNTKEVVEKMSYEVIYGDTDSIMINTNIVDHNQVSKIGNKIKQEINKLYKSVELDIDGVFKYLLLLKKKKYAAVILTKTKTGELKTEVEYKGLDVVRRDWSRLASEAGKFVLNQILSDQAQDDRITNIRSHLVKLREDLEEGRVPLSLLVIVKQLTKNPTQYQEKHQQPHVQVALRYNLERGGHLRCGDTVPYVICDDGTNKPATQRAYHIEELKNSETLKIDIKYYLSQQIYPVVGRICEPVEGMDAYQIAEDLGIDPSNVKKPKTQCDAVAENITRPEVKFRDCEKFNFVCMSCNTTNTVSGPLLEGSNVPFLEKCANQECQIRPVEYVANIRNQVIRLLNSYGDRYYSYELMCEDPMCDNETDLVPMKFAGKFPFCTECDNAVMIKKYTEAALYCQLCYLQHIFDPSKLNKKPLMDFQVEKGYADLRKTVETRLDYCAYSVVDLGELFSVLHQGTSDSYFGSAEDLIEENEEEVMD